MKPRHKYQPSGFDDEINEEEEKMETPMPGADKRVVYLSKMVV